MMRGRDAGCGEVPLYDPGMRVHREFLNAALKGLNLVPPHERHWPRDAIALIDHDETQCLVHVDISADLAYVRFCGELK